MAKNATTDLWVVPSWEGRPEYGSPTLDDGREVYDVIACGNLEDIPFNVWFERNTDAKGKRHGDILWSGGLESQPVSRRFAQAVAELGVADVKTYEIDLIDRRKGPIEGYVGFVPSLTGKGEISSWNWRKGKTSFAWVMSNRVLDGLLARGIDGFEYEPLEDENYIPPLK
ncbi:hypothetical protein [Galactobacter sp.]|uniref:hypothetical protein n=1 Tax=Galactobacter sp. TaxID=2676125 RepID=UPI0025C0DE5E|nr:hypothetical protein [Galactobacter sp.]